MSKSKTGRGCWAGVASRNFVVGWIADYADLDAKQSVEVKIGEKVLGRAEATEFRQHLQRRKIGDSHYGFSVALPSSFDLKDVDKISVTTVDDQMTEIPVKPPEQGENEGALVKNLPGPGRDLVRMVVASQVALSKGKAKDWDEINEIAETLHESRSLCNMFIELGRSALYRGDKSVALRFFDCARVLFPEMQSTQFYIGAVRLAQEDFAAASETFERLYRDGWEPERSGVELAKTLARMLNKQGHAEDPAIKTRLLGLVEALMARGKRLGFSHGLAQTVAQLGAPDLALRVVDMVIERNPDQPAPLAVKTRILIQLSRINEALELSEAIIKRWPDNIAAAYNLRVYSFLRDMIKPAPEPAFSILEPDSANNALRHDASSRLPDAPTVAAFTEAGVEPSDMLVVATADDPGAPTAWREAANRYRHAGCVQVCDGVELWRFKALADLAASGMLDLSKPLLGQLAGVRARYTPRVGRTASEAPGRVILLSKYGIAKFGGAEHTLQSLAAHYRTMGYETKIVGTAAEAIEAEALLSPPDIDYGHIEDDVAVMRREFLEDGAQIVHAISGMGYQVAQALEYTNIDFIYGIYFWRDVLGRGGETYFNEAGEPIPRPEFRYILSQAEQVFVNSRYTQAVVERAHGTRLPIIYSIPGDT